MADPPPTPSTTRALLGVTTVVTLALGPLAYWIARDAAFERAPADLGGLAGFESLFLTVELAVRGFLAACAFGTAFTYLSKYEHPASLAVPVLVMATAAASWIGAGWIGHRDAMSCIHTHYQESYAAADYIARHETAWLHLAVLMIAPIALAAISTVIVCKLRRGAQHADGLKVPWASADRLDHLRDCLGESRKTSPTD